MSIIDHPSEFAPKPRPRLVELPAPPVLSAEQLIELERLASIGRAIEDERAAKLTDLQYVAVAGMALRFLQMKEWATFIFGEGLKSPDELADSFAKWCEANKPKDPTA